MPTNKKQGRPTDGQKASGKTDEGLSLFSSAVNYIYGGGGVVTNFFSIDPDTSRICSSPMEPDTFMRDNIINHRGVNYVAKTKLQALPESVERGIRSLRVSNG